MKNQYHNLGWLLITLSSYKQNNDDTGTNKIEKTLIND